MFEPNRLQQEYLAQAYERITPVIGRSMGTRLAPAKVEAGSGALQAAGGRR
jgi:hypothetical protein